MKDVESVVAEETNYVSMYPTYIRNDFIRKVYLLSGGAKSRIRLFPEVPKT